MRTKRDILVRNHKRSEKNDDRWPSDPATNGPQHRQEQCGGCNQSDEQDYAFYRYVRAEPEVRPSGGAREQRRCEKHWRRCVSRWH